MRPNVLLVTLDQFRADHLSSAGHAHARTPHLDALAAEGVRFARHTSQAAPCGPGRASLYTGMYQCNHRVVGNGTPLDARFDNVALVARRAGTHAYVQFGTGAWLCFDLATDPTWRTTVDDPAVVLPLAQGMLTWRSRHTDRLLADLVLEGGGIGRWPPVPWRP